VSPNLVKKWVDDLSSLLCRDEGTNGGIRVRHLSISEFFLSNDCHSDFRINLEDSNTHQGIVCLERWWANCVSIFASSKIPGSPTQMSKISQSRIEQNVPDALQYSTLYWSNHLCFTPYKGDLGVQGSLKKFFEGLYPLFWLEVLSILRMVPIGAPSIRRAIAWFEVSKGQLAFIGDSNCCRTAIPPSSRECRIFVVLSSLSTPLSRLALHISTFQQGPSYPCSRLYQPSSAHRLLKRSRCKEGNCYHGQHRHCCGRDTPALSIA
jgi:hypothetical protein